MCEWYHGSPNWLTTLASGSTITQIRRLAEVFSHKPTIVSISDDGLIVHNGKCPGLLYVVDEDINSDDVYSHPHTTMEPGWEWLTRRELLLRLLGPATVTPGDDFAVMTMRQFMPKDQAAARKLILAGLGEHFGFIDESLNPDVDDISSHYLAHGHLFVVVLSDTTLVGTGGLVLLDECRAQIVRVSVSNVYRSRGIGRAIVAELIAAARGRGIVRIEVETNNEWESAIGLYLCLGFVEYRRDETSVYLALNLNQQASSTR
jgi:ribosomal protein S18 acetylase RimI-like enzyme